MGHSVFKIQGGRNLSGEIFPQGSKNEALQVVVVSLLTSERILLSNLPDILDVRNQLEILSRLGVSVERMEKNVYSLQKKGIDASFLSSKDFSILFSRSRGSILVLGALLSQIKEISIGYPGGDNIGRRHLDVHVRAFQDLGIDFEYDRNTGRFRFFRKILEPLHIQNKISLLMDESSVTATANVIFCSVLGNSKVIIRNAASEPYLQRLCELLCKMGANIDGVGTNLLKIEGVKSLSGGAHRVAADMIEVGSFVSLAAVTRSKIVVKNVETASLGCILRTFQKKMGINMVIGSKDLTIDGTHGYGISKTVNGSLMTIYDSPWPGFPPDLISNVIVTATRARGTLMVHQKMFESRLFFVDKLSEMGAQIVLCDPHRVVIIGLEEAISLRGITMSSPDIRAGISLLIAALSAKGESYISNIEQIDRGYEYIEDRLSSIGADIQRVSQ